MTREQGPPGRPGGSWRMPIKELGMREELRLKVRAMDKAPVGITISDAEQPDNPLIYLNDAFAELTGYAKHEAVSRNCRFLQGEESDPAAVAAMRTAIDRAEPVSVEVVNYRKDGEPFWNKVDIAPVFDEDGEASNFVGFQTDITPRKHAEFELQREREQLEHLLTRIGGLLQDVHGDLIRAVSREEVERSVCGHLAAADTYNFCWIGQPDLADDVIVETARAGAWQPEPAMLEIDFAGDSAGGQPIIKAFETGEVHLVEDPDELAAIAEGAPWAERALSGVAAIPLVYRETVYGVLTVYTTQRDALNDRETVVLEALGRAAATAINAIERGRLLVSDEVIELEFALIDPDLFLVDLAVRSGNEVEFNGSISQDDGSVLMFFTTGAEPGTVEAVARDHPDVEEVVFVNEHDGASLFEAAVGPDSMISRLAERGARTRSIHVADGTEYVTVELHTEADARAIVALLREQYPRTELVAYRERERPPQTKQEFIGSLKADLTERQLTALQTAYVSGYYNPNRHVSGDELAGSMGVARSTFHQHLRAAERKLIGKIFEA